MYRARHAVEDVSDCQLYLCNWYFQLPSTFYKGHTHRETLRLALYLDTLAMYGHTRRLNTRTSRARIFPPCQISAVHVMAASTEWRLSGLAYYPSSK